MLRKNVPVVPTAERLRAFEELKSALTSAPALGIFRNEGDIVVDIDASSTSAGAVCQQWQNGHLIVLEYASRCFSSAKRNYCASRREFCGLIFALKHFRVYLLGRKFVCRVDNLAVSHIQSQKTQRHSWPVIWIFSLIMTLPLSYAVVLRIKMLMHSLD